MLLMGIPNGGDNAHGDGTDAGLIVALVLIDDICNDNDNDIGNGDYNDNDDDNEKGDNSAGDYGSDNGHANGNDKNKW